MFRQQRPVVPAAELAVGVVEEKRRLEALQQALHRFRGQNVARGVVRRAEDQWPARIALDFGLQLLDRDAQIGTGRQEPRNAGRLEHEAPVQTEARLGSQHLAARRNDGGQRHRQQLVRAVADQHSLSRMAVQTAEVAAQLVGVEIRIAGPIRRQQALGHPPLEAPRQVPGNLVLIQLVAAGRQVEVVSRQGAQLGPHEASRISAAHPSLLRAEAA